LKGRVIDSSSGKPIEHFVVRLAQVSDPERALQMGASKGEFRVVLPPLPITVRVSASGYKEWRYRTDRDGNRDGSLFLARGKSHELNVVMRQSNASGSDLSLPRTPIDLQYSALVPTAHPALP
jgi:carboxypeptidase family protein